MVSCTLLALTRILYEFKGKFLTRIVYKFKGKFLTRILYKFKGKFLTRIVYEFMGKFLTRILYKFKGKFLTRILYEFKGNLFIFNFKHVHCSKDNNLDHLLPWVIYFTKKLKSNRYVFGLLRLGWIILITLNWKFDCS